MAGASQKGLQMRTTPKTWGSDRETYQDQFVSRLKATRTDVANDVRLVTVADVSEGRHWSSSDQPEVSLDDSRTNFFEGAQPLAGSGRAALGIPQVIKGAHNKDICAFGAGDERIHLFRRAAEERSPLVKGRRGDSKITGEFDPSDIPNSRVERLEGPITIDVGEAIRRFDGVASTTGASEIIRSRYWW